MKVSRSKLYLIKSAHIKAHFAQQDSVHSFEKVANLTPILGVNRQFVNFKGVRKAPRVEWAYNFAFLQATGVKNELTLLYSDKALNCLSLMLRNVNILNALFEVLNR